MHETQSQFAEGEVTIAWHYTVGLHFERIVEAGVLVPADPHSVNEHGIGRDELRRFYGNEKPAVWFSLRQDWEPTAKKGNATSRAETFTVGHGLVRLGLEEKVLPLNWTYHVNTSGILRKGARALERAAREDGSNPGDWRVVYGPVPIDDCIIDVFDPATDTWQRVREPIRRSGVFGSPRMG